MIVITSGYVRLATKSQLIYSTSQNTLPLSLTYADSQAVDSKTIFLKNESESNITEISCSRLFSGGDTGNYTWYHNGELMEGFYSSSLTLSRDGSVLTDNVFGVYQCFSNDGVRTVREVNLVRVLPYGELSLRIQLSKSKCTRA